MNPTLAEGQFGHGGLGHFLKPTDWLAHNFAPKDSTPFDWSKGYDVEAELALLLKDPNFKLPINNQGISSSCGGQALEKYCEVLSAIATGQFSRKSAKYPYAQIFQPGGGSTGGDLMNLFNSQGISTEDLCPSYQNGNPPTEVFMESVNDITLQARANAATDVSSGYTFIINFDIDTLAQAARDNHGFIGGILGQNNGTWLTQFPIAPTAPIGSPLLWGHWIFVGKAFMLNGIKYLVILNSWGDQIGVGGWQYISEDYINSGYFELGMTALMGVQKYVFNNDIYQGMTNADVFFLQKNLNKNPLTQIAATGPGSPGNETYYFGSLTKAAVIKYQKMNNITPSVGFVGPITRTLLNK